MFLRIWNLIFVNDYFKDNILNKQEFISLHMMKGFQLFLSNTNNSI